MARMTGHATTKVIMRTPTDSSRREAIEKYLAQRNHQALSRAKGGGCLVNMVKIIVILALGLAFAAGEDYLDALWSWGLSGLPTLTGEWKRPSLLRPSIRSLQISMPTVSFRLFRVILVALNLVCCSPAYWSTLSGSSTPYDWGRKFACGCSALRDLPAHGFVRVLSREALLTQLIASSRALAF